ncbi:kinase-like domain-containing protein [Scleroderma yunnanense]
MTENSTVRGLRQLSEQAKKLHINLNGLVDREESTPPIVGSKVLIYKGKLHPEYMRVAVKSIRFVLRGERKAVKRVLRDIKLWTRLQHENVVQVFGIATEFDFAVSIVCQWMELGNAHDYVQDKAIDPRSLLMGIARGLDYLHNHKLGPIFHGELKGRHVHIAEDGRPVLTDIGLSSFVESSFVMMATSSAAWSTRWMAPEILEEFKGASAEGDVWAFGMTALELFTRNPPFIDITNTYGVITRIIRGRPPERPSPETTCYRLTEEWWRICGMCWRHRPSSRPRISRIVEAIENLMHPTGQTTQMLTSPSAVAPTGLGSTTRVYTTIIGVKLFDILAMLRRHLPSVPSISGIYESPRQFIFLPPDGTPGVATDLDHMQITLTLTPKNIHGKQCTPVAWSST